MPSRRSLSRPMGVNRQLTQFSCQFPYLLLSLVQMKRWGREAGLPRLGQYSVMGGLGRMWSWSRTCRAWTVAKHETLHQIFAQPCKKMFKRGAVELSQVRFLEFGFHKLTSFAQNWSTFLKNPLLDVKYKVKAKQGLLSQHQFCIRL